MPESARVWVYQSDQDIDSTGLAHINSLATSFLTEWAAHGAPLKSAFKVMHNKFLVIAVDESFNKASGCSIDASVALVQELSNKLNLDLFNRTKVYFLKDDQLSESSINGVKELVAQGKVTKDTMTFNNLVPTVGEFKNGWVIPAQNSWLGRFF